LPLTSMRLLVLCIMLAVSIPVLLAVFWRRGPRSSRWALPAILVSVLVAQGAAVAALGVHLNRDYGFYPSWSSLFDTPSAPPVVTRGVRLNQSGRASIRHALRVSERLAGTGRLKSFTVKGAQSGITQTVQAWLPPQYDSPRFARTHFPVVMVLGGAGVHISYVVKRLDFARLASQEISSGRVSPFVAVFPEINVAPPLDTECVDYPGSTKAFTWLDRDVTDWAKSTLRVSHDGRRWGVMGWSTGGYCAAILHLRDPERFGAAASVEGYFAPEPDSHTGDLKRLLKQDQTLAHETSAAWLVDHRPPRPTHLLVMTSDKDPQSRPQSMQFLRQAGNVPGVEPYIVHGLGHSLNAYHAVLAPVLRWLTDVTDV
jgi:enterochelin esterase-like enzyme